MKLGQSRIDEAATTDGIWQDFVVVGPNGSHEISLRIGLANTNMNSRYKVALKKALEPFQRLLALYKKGSDVPVKLSTEVNDVHHRVFVQEIITNWKGITDTQHDSAGAPVEVEVPFTVDGCLKLFVEFPELLQAVEAEAIKFERFRIEVLDDAAKN